MSKRLLVLSFFFSLSAHAIPNIEPNERLVTLLSTNDIHGGVEPTQTKEGPQGGMAMLAGIVKAIRLGIKQQGKEKAGVLIVDAGDQFQGTLISNYDEGQLIFAAMNEVGYDAAVPGNHDYDFGPIGWLEDQGPQAEKRREALLRLVAQAKFPLISSNTFLVSSLKDKAGKKISVDNMGCNPSSDSGAIDWTAAKSPTFLKPFIIKNVADVRVALIGVDHPKTPSTTTLDNVRDLCFGDIETTYRRVRKSLEGKADIFVMVVHNGNAKTDKELTPIVENLTKENRLVDAVISGHTHAYYQFKVNGVPVLQSGSGGLAFGRIDLVWDVKKKQLQLEKTRSVAGLKLKEKSCDPYTKQISEEFCKVENNQLLYEGEVAQPDSTVLKLIEKARQQISEIATQKLGHAHKELTRDRIKENPLANEMTDTFRKLSNAEIATINTGGLRDIIKQGDFTYEDLFRVLPFGNHGVVVGPLSTEKLVQMLTESIKTCGSYGALMQSGLRIQFRRNCATADKSGGLDPNAQLVRVETLDGTVIYENGNITTKAPTGFNVATLDFIATGGSGFPAFKDVPKIKDLNILRETMKDYFLKEPANFGGEIDGRWKNLLPDTEPQRSSGE